MPDYLHVLDGRVRIKLKEIKGSRETAKLVEWSLLKNKGITQVKANPLTGNVLVLFDSTEICAQEILRLLKKFSSFDIDGASNQLTRRSQAVVRPQASRFQTALIEMIIQAAAEIAVKRLIFAFL